MGDRYILRGRTRGDLGPEDSATVLFREQCLDQRAILTYSSTQCHAVVPRAHRAAAAGASSPPGHMLPFTPATVLHVSRAGPVPRIPVVRADSVVRRNSLLF